MIVLEKSHENLSHYLQFLLKKDFNLIRKELFLVRKLDNNKIIMLTRFSERIFNTSRYTGV